MTIERTNPGFRCVNVEKYGAAWRAGIREGDALMYLCCAGKFVKPEERVIARLESLDSSGLVTMKIKSSPDAQAIPSTEAEKAWKTSRANVIRGAVVSHTCPLSSCLAIWYTNSCLLNRRLLRRRWI